MRIRHMTVTGCNCVVPLLGTVLQFAPRLETLRNTGWFSEKRVVPSSTTPADVASALERLEIDVAYVDDCRHLPPTLSVLDVEWPADESGDNTTPAFAARWTAAIVERFSALTRLRIGHVGSRNVYSLETLTERLPQLTDLSVPYCVIPAAPLVASRLETLACTFLLPDASLAATSSTSSSSPTTTTAPRVVAAPCLLGPALHTLDLVGTMDRLRFECGIELAASAPRLVSLAGLLVASDAEFAQATAALSHARLHTLRLRAPGVTTMTPLRVFSDSLRSLHVDRYHVLSRILAEVAPKDRSRAAVERVSEVVRHRWPALPKLVRLALHNVLDERDMNAVIARYPPEVDTSTSWGAERHVGHAYRHDIVKF
jgi:hypothetical protein